MPATWVYPKTWIAGEILTASDLNTQYTTITANFIPSGMDDYSASITEMRVMTDPYPGSVPSLATSLQGELERLRYQITQITGETSWEIDPDATIAGIMAGTNPVGGIAMTGEASANVTTATAVTLDLGSVKAGDRIFIQGCISENCTVEPTKHYGAIGKSGGTAVVRLGLLTGTQVATFQTVWVPWAMSGSHSAVLTVETDGTMTVYCAAGYTGGTFSSYSRTIYAFFLKKQ